MSQQREVDHVPNRVAVGQQHHQSVDADAESPGGGHAHLQGPHEVVVHLGHAVFGREPRQLRFEQLLLQPGVVQLGVRVRQFHPVDEQLEPLGDLGLTGLALGQRAHRGGVVDHEDRSRQVRFDHLFEDVVDDHIGVFPRGGDAPPAGHLEHRRLVVHVAPGVLAEQVAIPAPLPRRGEVDLVFAPGEQVGIGLGGLARRDRGLFERENRVREQRLGQLHHRLVVPVRLVEFDHGELGVVGTVHPLVPEDPANLVDPFDPADHQPLEMQLEGDPQVQRHVEGVVVREEGAGGGPPGDRVQHRGFGLDKAPLPQRLPDRVDNPTPPQHAVEHPVVVDEVDVPLPQQHLDVAGPVVLLGRLGQRLAQQRHPGGPERLLAGVRDLQVPVNSDQVAQVEEFDQLPLSFPEVGLRDHHLDPAGPVLHVEELELSLVVPQHDPPGDPRGLADHSRLGRARLAGAGDGPVPIESLTPGVNPQRFNLAQLVETGLLQTIGFRHDPHSG